MTFKIQDTPGNFPCPFCKIPFYTLLELLEHREKQCACFVSSSDGKMHESLKGKI